MCHSTRRNDHFRRRVEGDVPRLQRVQPVPRLFRTDDKRLLNVWILFEEWLHVVEFKAIAVFFHAFYLAVRCRIGQFVVFIVGGRLRIRVGKEMGLFESLKVSLLRIILDT